MLTKRAQILFDQNLWNQLVKLAKKQKTSVGTLTRNALEKTYFADSQTQIRQDREKAVDAILAWRKKYGKSKMGENTTTILRKMREDRTNHLLSLLGNK